jgi:hypothetical protein
MGHGHDEEKSLMRLSTPLYSNNDIRPGVTGCFLDESFDTPVVTPQFEVRNVLLTPNYPPVIVAKRGMSIIGLVVLEDILKPTFIPPSHKGQLPDGLPEESYYLPAHMSFFQVSGPNTNLVDKAAVFESIKAPEAVLSKNANRWTLYGETNDGMVHIPNMSDEDMRMKLACYGANNSVLDRAMNMKEMGSMSLWGLVDIFKEEPEIEKVGRRLDYRPFKKYAQDALEGYNEMAENDVEQAEDPKMMGAILSMQFASDDTIDELVESQDLFEEVEDKMAKLLMASRHGDFYISERPIQKALAGLGNARNALSNLEVEMESRK